MMGNITPAQQAQIDRVVKMHHQQQMQDMQQDSEPDYQQYVQMPRTMSSPSALTISEQEQMWIKMSITNNPPKKKGLHRHLYCASGTYTLCLMTECGWR